MAKKISGEKLYENNVNNYKLTKKRVQDSQTINVRKEADQNVRSQ